MTTVIKNRRTKQEQNPKLAWVMPCKEEEDESQPTHEARAETKLVWAMPCKKEEDEVNRRTKEEQRPNLFELCLARRRNTKSTDARSKSRGKLA